MFNFTVVDIKESLGKIKDLLTRSVYTISVVKPNVYCTSNSES